jgi:uncharacterized protein with beta-barrel porin domain
VSANAILTRFGIQAVKSIRVLNKNGRIGGRMEWIHNFDADRRDIDVALGGGSASARFQSSRPGADAVRAGIFGEVLLNERTSVRVNVDHQIQDKQSSTYTGISLGIQF